MSSSIIAARRIANPPQSATQNGNVNSFLPAVSIENILFTFQLGMGQYEFGFVASAKDGCGGSIPLITEIRLA